jgi:hypothetical protein
MLKKEIKIVNEMTKSELKQNITKIEQLLQSENYEAGFELLKTINELELNETLADLIQNKVEERYFQENSVQKEIDKGLEILEVLLPNLTSLDLKNSYLEKLDISKFTNLSSLDLEDCYSIETLDGLDKLKHLTDLNLINTPRLIDLDVKKLKYLPNVVGLRDELGLITENISLDYWFDTLDEFLKKDFDFHKGWYEGGYFGKFILLLINERDFYDNKYDNLQGPVTARWRAGRGTPDEFKDALGGMWIWQKCMNYELEYAPAKDEVVVLIYTLGEPMTAICSYEKNSCSFGFSCNDCSNSSTFGDLIQVDPDDEWVRCCPDCVKERTELPEDDPEHLPKDYIN